MAAEAAQVKGPTDAGLISDGQILPVSGLQSAFEAGNFASVLVLSSTTRDEWNFVNAVVHYSLHRTKLLSTADFDAFVDMRANKDPRVAAQIKMRYPLSGYRTPQQAITAIGTQGGAVFSAGRISVWRPFPKQPQFMPLSSTIARRHRTCRRCPDTKRQRTILPTSNTCSLVSVEDRRRSASHSIPRKPSCHSN
jgi:hypothetical protein